MVKHFTTALNRSHDSMTAVCSSTPGKRINSVTGRCATEWVKGCGPGECFYVMEPLPRRTASHQLRLAPVRVTGEAADYPERREILR